jgi:hypothetical protein
MVRRMDLPRAQAVLEQDEPPPGWEDEAELAPREDEDGFELDAGDDADDPKARRRGDL